MELPQPTRGKHRYQHCQRLYEEVHSFLNDRSWAHAHPESTAGGITWAELFVLFDTAGHRTTAGQHVQDVEAIKRAEARSAKQKRTRKSKWHAQQGTVVARATYEQEIKRFKAIVREVTRHGLDDRKRVWFHMESRRYHRRLVPLGIHGNQPAIAVYCQTTEEEQGRLVEALLQQKIGATSIMLKKIREYCQDWPRSSDQVDKESQKYEGR